MRLAAASRADRGGAHGRRRLVSAIGGNVHDAGLRRNIALRRRCGGEIARPEERVRVRRDLRYSERNALHSARLGKRKSTALVQGESSAKVGKGEGAFPIAAIG